MARIERDQLGLLLASAWALRGTCARRQVGCVLFDEDGHELSTGYNGPASGVPHCRDGDRACAGASLPSGEGLDVCEAIHAEANALIRVVDVRQIHTAYVTHSPCVHCVKLLMNTSCRRIVFAEPYAHDDASQRLWVTSHPRRPVWLTTNLFTDYDRRTWEHVPMTSAIGPVLS